MDFIGIGKALSDLGGWAAFLALIVAIAVGGVRRWWVFGWIFDRLEARNAVTETQAERNADALTDQSVAHTEVAKAVRDLADSLKAMARSYDRIDVRLEALERGGVKRE